MRWMAEWLLIKFFTGIISTRAAYCLFEATCCNVLRLALCSQGQPWFLSGAYSERVTVWQEPLRFWEIGEGKRWEIHFCKSFEPNRLRHTEREGRKKTRELQKATRKTSSKTTKQRIIQLSLHQWDSSHLECFVVGVVLVVAVVVVEDQVVVIVDLCTQWSYMSHCSRRSTACVCVCVCTERSFGYQHYINVHLPVDAVCCDCLVVAMKDRMSSCFSEGIAVRFVVFLRMHVVELTDVWVQLTFFLNNGKAGFEVPRRYGWASLPIYAEVRAAWKISTMHCTAQ